jgi:signal transduction histidine kinase
MDETRAPDDADAEREALGSGDFTDLGHVVQFYENPESLFETVGRFLGAGISVGDRLLVVAKPAHAEGILKHLEPMGARAALETGQLTVVDAAEALATFMVGDTPDPELFRASLSQWMARAKGDREGVRIRVYGEMVDLLFERGDTSAAIRLEELWNQASATHSFSLLCAYLMGHFYREGDAARFMDVCRNHSHVIPTESFTSLHEPNARMREISVLQQRARALESEIQHRKEVESALRDALHERSRIEEELRASLEREKDARALAEASDAFKEVFLGILGHDLRNPLNTVLTTARLMIMRCELPPESHKRLERVVVSGVRMERMIEQLLDLTRARLAGGIAVTRGPEQDLAPLVAKIIAELKGAHPTRGIELHLQGPCMASVDADRFEQVVSNLLGNAIMHGDKERSIAVTLDARGSGAVLSVHNFGPPIETDLMPFLFDPFKRGRSPKDTRPGGLGLGLYITERIVGAHGGTITVASSLEAGTRFEAVFPRGC